MKGLSLITFTGLVLATLFTAIALYLLWFPGTLPAAGRENVRLYALLTGSYGIWRFVRVYLAWREAQKNSENV